MRKIIAAINLTLDGIVDHTAGIPDEDIHAHYADLLRDAGAILYGRVTYDLMGFWQTLIQTPSGDPTLDDFAVAMDAVPKIVFSRTMTDVNWSSARLATRELKDEVLELKKQSGKDIYVGSRSLINQLMNLDLIDELQLCFHPVVQGSGSPLFDDIHQRTVLKLIKTKVFGGGAVVMYYEPAKKF